MGSVCWVLPCVSSIIPFLFDTERRQDKLCDSRGIQDEMEKLATDQTTAWARNLATYIARSVLALYIFQSSQFNTFISFIISNLFISHTWKRFELSCLKKNFNRTSANDLPVLPALRCNWVRTSWPASRDDDQLVVRLLRHGDWSHGITMFVACQHKFICFDFILRHTIVSSFQNIGCSQMWLPSPMFL